MKKMRLLPKLTPLNVIIIFSLCVVLRQPALVCAQPLAVDEATTLLLRFNGGTSPTFGAQPLASTGLTFQEGLHGQAAYFGEGSTLEFANEPGLTTEAGTIEFWVKPAWTSGIAVGREFVWWGDLPGSFAFGHYGSWLLVTFNAATAHNYTVWASHGDAFKLSAWNHITVTWSPTKVRIFLNGRKLTEEAAKFPFVPPTSGHLQIGGSPLSGPLLAALDELRISSTARDEDEIYQSYVAGFAARVESLDVRLPTLNFHPDWHLMPRVSVQVLSESFDLRPSEVIWFSSDTSVAEGRADGRIHSKSAGSADITARFGDHTCTLTVSVTPPVLPPVFETVDAFLAEPAPDAAVVVPIVIMRFLPTTDGVMLDDRSSPDFWWLNPVSLDYMRARTLKFDRRVKFGVEEGSKFRGYKRPHAKPYLGYKVVAYITVYEVTPPRFSPRQVNGYDIYYHDYHSLFERFGLDEFVEKLGVREFWLWDSSVDPTSPSFDPDYNIVEHARMLYESNMSSPLMVDVSNSNRDISDLPILNHTYIVYGQNMRRTQAEALHNRGHQFEAMFAYAAWLQDPNPDYNFFWNDFVGRIGRDQHITGRAGWTHMPPNTTNNYSTTSPILVESDIEDWRPDNLGQKKQVNVDTWASIDYHWPGERDFLQKDETQWYVYWFQNFPGHWGNIPYENSTQVSNWWEFVADWDKAMISGLGLYRPRAQPNYSEWRAAHGLPETPDHNDRDIDGAPLLMKYVTGTSLGRPVSSELTRSGNTWFLEFDRLANAADVEVSAATSTQLDASAWSISSGEQILDNTTDLHRVRVEMPSMHGRGFARLLATPSDSLGPSQVSAVMLPRTLKRDAWPPLPPMPENLAPKCLSCEQPWRRDNSADR